MSDYREESRDGEVGLREEDGTVSWGWTTKNEWLLYTVKVSMDPRRGGRSRHCKLMLPTSTANQEGFPFPDR